jgi:hypothetical protein
VSSDPLATWIALDERYQGDRPSTREVRVVRYGPCPLVFTAPHSVRHHRHGVLKKADIRTGGLAELLAQEAGGLAVTSLGRLAADPNFDRGPTPFRDRLLAELQPGMLVLDLHGMEDRHGLDAVIGLGVRPDARSEWAAAELERRLAARGLSVRAGHPFPASHAGTVTSTVQVAGFSAVQVELAAARRRPLRAPEATLPLVEALLAWAAAATAPLGLPRPE